MPIRTCAALCLTAGAAWMDIRSTKVKNSWIAGWILVGSILQLAGADPPAIGRLLAGMAAPLILYPLFFFRMMGARDIKVLMALGILTGPGDILSCMFFTFLIAGAMSLILFLIQGGFADRLRYFFHYILVYLHTGKKHPYTQAGDPAGLHMTIPIFLTAILWSGGLIPIGG